MITNREKDLEAARYNIDRAIQNLQYARGGLLALTEAAAEAAEEIAEEIAEVCEVATIQARSAARAFERLGKS